MKGMTGRILIIAVLIFLMALFLEGHKVGGATVQQIFIPQPSFAIEFADPVRVFVNKWALPEDRDAIWRSVIWASAKYNVDAQLICAVILCESYDWRKTRKIDPRATSHCGARGLMQLTPAHYWGNIDPYNIMDNIDRGTWLLATNLERLNGDIALSVAAYNAGIGRVAALGRIPDIKQTQAYVARVMHAKNTITTREGGELLW